MLHVAPVPSVSFQPSFSTFGVLEKQSWRPTASILCMEPYIYIYTVAFNLRYVCLVHSNHWNCNVILIYIYIYIYLMLIVSSDDPLVRTQWLKDTSVFIRHISFKIHYICNIYIYIDRCTICIFHQHFQNHSMFLGCNVGSGWTTDWKWETWRG